jgi:hypothetical protein
MTLKQIINSSRAIVGMSACLQGPRLPKLFYLRVFRRAKNRRKKGDTLFKRTKPGPPQPAMHLM